MSGSDGTDTSRRPRRWGRWLLKRLLGVAVVLGITFLSRVFIERRLFYFPDRAVGPVPLGVEAVRFESSDGMMLSGWWMPPAGYRASAGPMPAVVHAHGNAGNVESHAGISSFLTSYGFGVLVFDYRGYGASDGGRGDLRRERLVEDTIAAVRYVRSREDVDASRVGLMGQSLGVSFAATAAARLGDVPAVALVSGFASWKGIARDHAGVFGTMLMRGGVDTRDAMARLGATPVLVVHGTADEIVPVHHAERIVDAARSAGVPVEQILLDGARHNDAPEMHPAMTDGMAAFFASHLAGD